MTIINPGASDQLLDSISIMARPRKFLIYSSGAITFLILMSLLAVAISGPENILSPIQFDQPASILVQAFFLDRESSVPTIFNYSLLVAACGLLFFVARMAFTFNNSKRYHWLILGFVFLLLSFDEAAQIHEKLVEPMRKFFNASGIFHFAWIIPGMAFVTIFAFAYLNFLRTLPARIALMMILAGVLYVSGAIGMEMVGGWADASGLRTTWAYIWAVTFEEGLEMFGVAIFCTAILILLSEGSSSKNGYFKCNDPNTSK